ncbi:MAG: amidohydrolase family protein [Candidatus Parcubacteria bacterium]|nr:amidohydrolase family protein [Candidatus Parcubacteria bacterium]
MARYNVIIKNGMVFDGKNNKPERADVAVEGDEIGKIGDLGRENADKIIDAAEKYVAPGFIDLTNHSDTHWTLFSQPTQESLLRQGITTILGGNCGTSVAPFLGETSLEEIQRWVDVSKININWQSVKEFLSQLENLKIGLNFATLVGLNTIQRAVNGDFGQMEFLLRSALGEGAFGVSTNLGLYPAKSLKDEELINLFNIIKKENGVAKHHLEDEGENILPAISRLISLARKSKSKTHFSHFKALGRNSWNFFPEAIEMIKRAREEGLKITCDFFPYTKTGSNLFNLLPSWIKKLKNEEVSEILKPGPDKRRSDLIDYLRELTLHYDKIIVASASSELDVVGKTIEQLSKSSGLSGEEIILSLLDTNNLRVSIFNEVISLENIEQIAKEEFSAIASDGVGYDLSVVSRQSSAASDLPHPRSFGAFPRAFNLLVKENSLFNWEEIIYKMSGLPAGILGLKDRGTIEKGSKADIVVFDPQEISDYATYDNPFQYSRGIKDVLVNGTPVLDNEKLTGRLPGYVLRKK